MVTYTRLAVAQAAPQVIAATAVILAVANFSMTLNKKWAALKLPFFCKFFIDYRFCLAMETMLEMSPKSTPAIGHTIQDIPQAFLRKLQAR